MTVTTGSTANDGDDLPRRVVPVRTTSSAAQGRITLLAGEDNDRIFAGTGDDLIDGGTGNDTIFGAGGVDTFVFGPDFGDDVIRDFDPNGELIDLTALPSGFLDESSARSQAARFVHHVARDDPSGRRRRQRRDDGRLPALRARRCGFSRLAARLTKGHGIATALARCTRSRRGARTGQTTHVRGPAALAFS